MCLQLVHFVAISLIYFVSSALVVAGFFFSFSSSRRHTCKCTRPRSYRHLVILCIFFAEALAEAATTELVANALDTDVDQGELIYSPAPVTCERQ
jgi:hypothetical protein